MYSAATTVSTSKMYGHWSKTRFQFISIQARTKGRWRSNYHRACTGCRTIFLARIAGIGDGRSGPTDLDQEVQHLGPLSEANESYAFDKNR